MVILSRAILHEYCKHGPQPRVPHFNVFVFCLQCQPALSCPSTSCTITVGEKKRKLYRLTNFYRAVRQNKNRKNQINRLFHL